MNARPVADERCAQLRVVDDAGRSRYEAHVRDVVAGFTDYHAQPGLITLLDTRIDPRFEGEGLGSRFVAAVLDDIRRRDARILAVCPFVRAFLRRHPEYADLVAYA